MGGRGPLNNQSASMNVQNKWALRFQPTPDLYFLALARQRHFLQRGCAPAVGGKVRKRPPYHERHSGDAGGGGGPPLGECPRSSDVDLGATMAMWREREIRDAGSRQKQETSSLDKMEVQSESK